MEFLTDLQVFDMAKSLTSREAAREILANFLPLVNEVKLNFNKLASIPEDPISKALMPSDHSDWIPLVSTPNGDCLFNAVSVALSGGEALAATLRLLTVSELLGHCDFYGQHPQLVSMAQASGYSVPAVINILLSNEKAEKVYGESGSAVHAIEVLVKETAKLSVYSSQFHIMALASVIGQPIKVVYPDIPSTIRVKRALHCVLYPREVSASEISQRDLVCVMWTRASRSSLHGWQPNHFVPLLCKRSKFDFGRQSYADAVTTSKRGSSKRSSEFSTSAPTTKSHRAHYTSLKAQTIPEDRVTVMAHEKKYSAQASVPPSKVRTEVKSFQSATTAAPDVLDHAQMKRKPTPNTCTLREGKHYVDSRIKLQRKRSNCNSKTMDNAPSTATVKPDTAPVKKGKQDGPPVKVKTQVKSFQSEMTAAPDVLALVRLAKRATPNASTSCEGKHHRVKIQRKRRQRKTKTNDNDPTTAAVKPMPIKPSANISSYFITKPSKPSLDKDNESNTGDIKDNEINTGYNKDNESNMTGDIKDNEINSAGDIYEVSEDEEILPLAGPGFSWYKKKGKNAAANLIRSEERMRSGVVIEDRNMKGLIRGSVTGTLAQNVDCLIERLSKSGTARQQEHLKAMISLAKYILDNGMIVPTQDVAKKYRELKGLNESSRIESARLIETISKHLNVIQIYIRGRGYIIENHGSEVIKLVNSLENLTTLDQKTINEKVEEAVGNNYQTIIQYLDSKRDRDTLNTVLTKITSVNFMKKMAKVTDKRSLRRSKDLTMLNLQLFKEMKNSVEEVDCQESKLSEEARRRKKHRILQKMKLEKLRHIFKGRGRKLKCEEFPDLAAILEFAFGEGDRIDRAGGGLECHPRLTDTVLYRAADSNTIMKHARETILALAPEGFNICLSSCFNYTQNYREGSHQAKRHHAGKGVNACLSLHKPPRIGVEQLVVNLHWSTHNVNLTMDMAHLYSNNVLIDSKDAKAKINADVSPVQKPGKTWKRITLPDHDWDRLAITSVTPMSHLFMETDINYECNENDNYYYNIRRTGAAATLLNLSYFEPETVHRVFNEVFLLLINPALDKFFRKPDTNKLKEHFVFIVDNGASEAPSNSLVKIWLARLAKVLNLKSVTQKSFAEYHSKRNPVERVHAGQNRALSNEVFSSTSVHKHFQIGDEMHRENMEHMAQDVKKCLSYTQYGGQPCVVLRGIGSEENFIFNDEKQLLTFMAKNEFLKNQDNRNYLPVKNHIWEEMCTLWDLNDKFVGSYREDYQTLQNSSEEEGERTCWMDKYSTIVFNPIHPHWDKSLFTLQPIADYVRWIISGGELHYLPFEKVHKLPTQVIDETPAAFLPSKILEMIFKVFSHGIEGCLHGIAFLSWCTKDEVEKFFSERKEKLDESFQNEKDREYWSQDVLYKTNDKAALQELCKKNDINFQGRKHEYVKRIIKKLDRKRPPMLERYNGELSPISTATTEIAKLSVFKLREILRFHNILDCGTKDELVLRVGMLKVNRGYLAFYKETEAIVNLITATRTLIRVQKDIHLTDPKIIHKKRRFSTPSDPTLSSKRPRYAASVSRQYQNSFLDVPVGITVDSLQEVLDPLQDEILLYEQDAKNSGNKENLHAELFAIKTKGVKVLAFWGKDEVGLTGWKTGWYKGTVVSYDEKNDTIQVEFDTEQGIRYKYSVTKDVASNKIKLARGMERLVQNNEAFFQIGVQVEMYWSKDELTTNDWVEGWHAAEVQSIDYDSDEIDLIFLDDPEQVYSIPVMPNIISKKLRLKQRLF